MCVSLGVSLVVFAVQLHYELQRGFESHGNECGVLITAKGNPGQAVLSTLLYIDVPVGVISNTHWTQLAADPRVKAAYPVVIGDSFHEYRIVGVPPDYFHRERRGNHGFRIADGRLFESEMEVIAGARVAEACGLKPGDTFRSTHGFDEVLGHLHDAPFRVVGILEPQSGPADVALYASLESVWTACGSWKIEQSEFTSPAESNHLAGAITAVMVDLNPGESTERFIESYNRESSAMALSPSQVIERLFVKEYAIANRLMLSAGIIVSCVALVSLMGNLYLSIAQRKRDLAIMRALGAKSSDVFALVLWECGAITLLSLLFGAVCGRVFLWIAGTEFARLTGIGLEPFHASSGEFYAAIFILMLGMAAGAVPGMLAYRRDIATDLAEP